jgi:hypothetical protein
VSFLEFSLSLICIGFHGRPFSSERNDAFEEALTDIIELLKKEKFEDNLERYYNKLVRAFGLLV